MDKTTLIQFAKETYSLTLLFPKKEPLRWRLREAADEINASFVLRQNDWFYNFKAQLEIIDSYLEIAAAQNWVDAVKIIDLRMQGSQIGRDIDWEKRISAPEAASSNPRQKEECFHMPAAEKLTLKEGLNPDNPIQVAPENVEVIEAKEPEIEFHPVAIEKDKPATPSSIEKAEDDEDEDDGANDLAAGLTSSQIARQTKILEFLKEKGGAQVWEIQKIFPDISKRTIRRDFRSLLKQDIIERTGERNTIAYKLKVNLA